MQKSRRILGLVAAATCAMSGLANAQQNANRSRNVVAPEGKSLSLATFNNQDKGQPAGSSKETTIIKTTEKGSDSWDIAGPVFLRSADPTPQGELEIKNIFGWSTSRGGEDDEAEFETEIEWGFAQNHELIVEVPWQLGDGDVDGNADITLGWHWRLWEEQDALPAFAMRNYIRIPSGIDSAGVDYIWRGLMTKTLVPDALRLHFNPFLKSVNGNNEPDARHFQWGTALGVDYRISDALLLIVDYRYENGELERTRDNHTAEFGLDWAIADNQKIGFATDVGLDGDGNGPALGARISYILSFGG